AIVGRNGTRLSAVLPAVARRRRALEHGRTDEVALDLDSTGADAQAPDVAVHALDGELAREPVAPEELNGLVTHEFGREVRGRLRHRGLERGRCATRARHVQRALEEEPCTLEL